MFLILLVILSGVLLKHTHIKPYSFLLILYGIVIGVINEKVDSISIFKDSIDYWSVLSADKCLLYFIPPIIYYASLTINIHIFRKTFFMVISLSIFGVIINNVLTSLFLYGIDIEFRNQYCLLLGSILSAIDPIAITSILSELKLSEKLSNLIEIESLLNDEVALIIFNVIVDYTIKNASINSVIGESMKKIFGSIFLSILFFIIQINLLHKLYGDFIAEITLTFCFSYFSYFISEYSILKTSGIMTVLILGLCMSSWGKTRISPQNVDKLYHIWELLSDYSTSLIFTISGLIIYNKLDYSQIDSVHWGLLVLLYIYINLVRCMICCFFRPWLSKHIFHYDVIDFYILSLSGLRGEISLALSLIIYHNDSIPLSIRNLILFYVVGIVFLTIFINSNLIRFIVHYYHRDKILLDTKQVKLINSHLDKEGNIYIENLKSTDFHLGKVNFTQVKENISSGLDQGEICRIQMTDEQINQKIFLNTLKKTIWNLFEDHVLHYDVVMKLIEITDSSLDNMNNNIDKNWDYYMNDYCTKEHIYTFFICLLKDIPILNNLQKFLIYHRIEYNYNLITGYIVSLEQTLIRLKDIIEDEDTLNHFSHQVHLGIIVPENYVKYLEEKYDDILEKIETLQVSLLVISKQKSHLQKLLKNGEINDSIFEKLIQKLHKKEYLLKHS